LAARLAAANAVAAFPTAGAAADGITLRENLLGNPHQKKSDPASQAPFSILDHRFSITTVLPPPRGSVLSNHEKPLLIANANA